MSDDKIKKRAEALDPVATRLHRGKFAAGAAREKGMRRVLLDLEVAKKAPKGRSEKSRSEWRNDPKRDEEIFRYINTKLRAGTPVRMSPDASHIVSRSRKTLADAERAGVRVIPELFLPHWDHSSRLMKMIGWGMASRELNAIPFTLRVSNEVMEVARKDPVGTGRHMQDRLARHLRYRSPDSVPTFWFAIEQGMWDEPHLHGAVVIPTDGKDAVRKALASAGGEWSSTARQVQFGRPGNLIKWVGYSTKWLFGSMVRMRDERLTGASQRMRKEAKLIYQDARTRCQVLYP